MTINEQYNKIKNNFYDKTKLNIVPGSSIDCFNMAISESIQDAYDEIEKNKYPYFFTDLSGDDLDSFGNTINFPRQPNESDDNYKYRLFNWRYINESANIIAINAALLNLEYASHAEYKPYIYGCGTAAVYIIPVTYDDDTINNAIKEVKEKLNSVVSPGSYIEYIIPTLKKVKLVIKIQSDNGDLTAIENNIQDAIKEYINGISINQYLSLGEINKIGINTIGVDYFNTAYLFIDDIENVNLQILQTIDSKFIFDSITWI